jgi:hypothetical protein
VPVDVNRIRKEGIYRVEASHAQVREDMTAIALASVRFAKTRKTIAWSGAGVLVLGIGIAAVTSALAFFAGLAVAIVIWVIAARYGRGFTKYEYRFKLLGHLADMLATDANPSKPLSVELGLKDRGREIRSQKLPARGGKQVFFLDEYLKVEGRFGDGSYFRQEFVEIVRKRTYRTARGKTKSKTRSTYIIATRLAYPAKRYGNARPVAHKYEYFKLPKSARLKLPKITEKAIGTKVVVRDRDDLLATAGQVFLGTYRILQASRAAAAGGAR